MNYQSTKECASARYPGVTFTIARVSLSRRLDLASRIREAGRAMEFHQAGKSTEDVVSAVLTAGEIERICLQWGLVKVDGFTIDGQAVDAEALAARGPEDLAREVIDAIRFECGLTPEERKN